MILTIHLLISNSHSFNTILPLTLPCYHLSTDPLCSDTVYSIDRAQCQEPEPEWIPSVDQTLSLFLFLQHSDRFLSDFMGEQINSTKALL
jgi:hypothetical protein